MSISRGRTVKPPPVPEMPTVTAPAFGEALKSPPPSVIGNTILELIHHSRVREGA
jgi:hypothetical protein